MTEQRVIYLHGFASGPGSNKAQFFRQRFANYGIDLRIPALDAGDFSNLTITGQLEVIGRAVDGGPVTLLGSSMGGYLAALYAARHTEVERVVLMAPAFGFARRLEAMLGDETLHRWRLSGSLKMYHYSQKRYLPVSYQLIEDGSDYEDYPHVTQPVLILHGERDDHVPALYSREFAAGRPNVRLIVYDSGHELLDVVEQMWVEIREFCKIMLS
jgi:pimeloyl-ACP methyl ester carboxylesterase